MKNTGHTYDPDETQRIRNLCGQLPRPVVMDCAARSNGDPHELERWLTGALMADCNGDPWQGQATEQDDAAVMAAAGYYNADWEEFERDTRATMESARPN